MQESSLCYEHVLGFSKPVGIAHRDGNHEVLRHLFGFSELPSRHSAATLRVSTQIRYIDTAPIPHLRRRRWDWGGPAFPQGSEHERIAMDSPGTLSSKLAGARVIATLMAMLSLPVADLNAAQISFNRDIRPLLSENCFECHGPGVRQPTADLYLHKPSRVILAGNSEASLLIERVGATEPHRRMPPPVTGKRLSEEQIELLKRWIDSGASFEEHWAFVPPSRPTVPSTREKERIGNPIDAFVLKRLEDDGLRPSPPADRRTLIRRASLDVTGLPPDPSDLRDFLADSSRQAYERLVERLLESPHYGERMAQEWLDAARYADTTGFAADHARTMWHYRDWVVSAFNSNMPFDQFTIEQLAGDMLPGATQSQRIATGFHRNSMQALGNNPRKEEFRVKGIVDRIDTTGRVWLGMTVACAECHDHKYDPISQQEYYQLFAVFNNIPHYGKTFGVHGPRLLVDLEDTELPIIESDMAGTDPATLKARLASEGLLTAQVMVEMVTPRQTHIHVRGNFENKGQQVVPGVPSILGRIPDGVRADRLSFARWLVDGQNPLVARVFVNRLWQQFFGTGLVRTVEDFGNQGEFPSHPELLDWLAVEFVESGWDVRHMVKLIVTSTTYRQSSKADEELLSSDFYNRLLGRGPRRRLPAEQVRDNMLAVSGLLSRKVGGPGVYPVQPSHIGQFRDKTAGEWKTSDGEDRYRRGIYTYWQRMYPYPSFALFDAPSRERSCVRRNLSNTPLQALVLLNDPVSFDAARAFGGRILLECKSGTDPGRIEFAYETALARLPTTEESEMFQAFLQKQRNRFAAESDLADAVVDGRSAVHASLPAVELATWTMVASTILALDETISKQ